ncbi:putative bifunctional diguanylate cyclase/phosphodiesterase [Gandjariella thermophila]|uniref:GGDEF domain-containing protein n=1 Tax=Gandjariella thermophila TaxID=1931992 RepID=A0A4D4J131_9PSEU|nr:EAL domain-containing protein [Gandjariella thermophila]GDY28782.1 GGDEF domain-containing protein [Gandjariella thermophila]
MPDDTAAQDTSHRTGSARSRAAGAVAFARRWAAELVETSHVPMSLGQVEEFLLPLTELIAAALESDPFDAEPVVEVGDDLVAMHFTGEGVLRSTLALVTGELPELLCLPGGPDLVARAGAVCGVLADAYAHALRQRTLDEQETIKRAVLKARDAMEQRLRASEERFRTVFTTSAVGIGIVSTDWYILDANESLLDILGYERDELSRTFAGELVHPDDISGLADLYGELVRGQRRHFTTEKRLLRSNGDQVWAHMVVSLVRDERGEPDYHVVMVEDVSELHLLQEWLRHQAVHDRLTGLPNRAQFVSRVESAAGRAGPTTRIALCHLGIDGFKVLNNGLGHDVGDGVLRETALRLRSLVPESRGLVARTGGDEFGILLERTSDTAEVVDLVERALRAVAEPIRTGGHEVSVSASAGVVERRAAGADPAELLRDAALTLHWAKTDGRAQWTLFDAERSRRDRDRLELAATIPTALRNGEFFVAYQPQVRLADGVVVGVDALARWDHPVLGELGAERFLDLAEQTGSAVPLGWRLLGEACAQATEWRRTLPGPALAVNVRLGLRHWRDPELIGGIRSVLADSGLDAERLRLEVPAAAVLAEDGDLPETLEVLGAIGVRVVLTGLRPGHVDRPALELLPVHGWKVSRVPAETAEERGLAELVALAHKADRVVVADGVATEEHATRLRDLGVDVAQGPHYGEPGHAADIEELLADR